MEWILIIGLAFLVIGIIGGTVALIVELRHLESFTENTNSRLHLIEEEFDHVSAYLGVLSGQVSYNINRLDKNINGHVHGTTVDASTGIRSSYVGYTDRSISPEISEISGFTPLYQKLPRREDHQ